MGRSAGVVMTGLALCLAGTGGPVLGQAADRGSKVIAGAVLAAPAQLRDAAEVRVWTDEWALETIRAGGNGLICLADKRTDEGFHSACYHESLEPFMAAGRTLRARGLSGAEYQQARWELVDAGEVRMPPWPAMVYNFFHDDPDFDPGVDDEAGGARLHAIYLAGMTIENTGLPTNADGSGPWLMAPGRPSAHVMISLPGA